MGNSIPHSGSEMRDALCHDNRNFLPPGTLPIYWVAARIMSSSSLDRVRFVLPDPAGSGVSVKRMCWRTENGRALLARQGNDMDVGSAYSAFPE